MIAQPRPHEICIWPGGGAPHAWLVHPRALLSPTPARPRATPATLSQEARHAEGRTATTAFATLLGEPGGRCGAAGKCESHRRSVGAMGVTTCSPSRIGRRRHAGQSRTLRSAWLPLLSGTPSARSTSRSRRHMRRARRCHRSRVARLLHPSRPSSASTTSSSRRRRRDGRSRWRSGRRRGAS